MLMLVALSCALAASPSAEDFLLARAAEAAGKGDRGALTDALRGWATLGPKRALPAGLEKEAAEALAWADRAGRFRLFASRLEDRVRVGLHDPAALSSRIDAYAVVNGETLRIARAADEAFDRLEFRVDAAEAPVVVEAVMTRFGTELVLARAELAPPSTAQLPSAPTLRAPKTAAGVRCGEHGRSPRPAGASCDQSEEDVTPWWLIAAGVGAALLAGAAVWQETR